MPVADIMAEKILGRVIVRVIAGLEPLEPMQLIALPPVVMLEQPEVDGGTPSVIGEVWEEQGIVKAGIIVRPLREEMFLVMVLLTLLLMATVTGPIML